MKNKYLVLVASVFLSLPAVTGAVQGSSSPSESGRVPNEVIVRFKSARAMGLARGQRRANAGVLRDVPPEVRNVHARFGVRDVRRIVREDGGVSPRTRRRAEARSRGGRGDIRRAQDVRDQIGRTVVLTVATAEDMRRILNAYRALPDVEMAEENRIYSVQMTPNDPSYSQLWGMTKIQAPTAWDLSTGTGVVVAVVDTGIDAAHPDLAAALWSNPGEIPGNGLDDDGNGYADDVYGWDCVTEDPLPSDVHGHGSHVAGTIAAAGNNGVGVIGLAFNAKLMAVKGLNDSGNGTSADLAQALVYAADNGADVINNSWGGMGTDPVIDGAVAYAVNLGAVVVAAAGNSNTNVDTFYPARLPGVIAVSAFDSNDLKASFSNYGSRIDVAAPGVGILSTTKGVYSSLNGTSMASPHVAGLAALILSQHPDYSASQVRQLIRQSADDVAAPGFDVHAGHGRINAFKALTTLPGTPDTTPPLITIASPANGATLRDATVVSGTASDNGTLYKIDILVDGTLQGTASGLANWTYTLNPTGFLGAHTLTARATDIEGNIGSTSIQFIVVNNGNAVYDPALKVPACGIQGSFCDSGNLLLGRGTIAKGNEPNVPNTLGSSCSDGNTGSFHSDESNDRIRIFTLDDSPLTVGAVARVEATVWAYGVGDFLDLYSAGNALEPSWTLLATLPVPSAGAHTLSSTFTLPSGQQQVVRAKFRYGGNNASPCLAGSYNDHDDLVFAVQGGADITPPAVFITSPLNGEILKGSLWLQATATDTVGVAGVQWRVDGVNVGPSIPTPPYWAQWNTALGPDGYSVVEAVAWDAAGNHETSTRTVVVNNLFPSFVSVSTPTVTAAQATLTWVMNEPFSSFVVGYGTSASYGEVLFSSQPASVNGSVTLNALLPRTAYHAHIRVDDSAGQRVFSDDILFTTKGDTVPPTLNGILVTSLTGSSARITWTTDEPADTQVEYGITATLGLFSPLQSPFVTTHTVNLAGLMSGTPYYFRVRSRDAEGNLSVSGLNVFSTPDSVPPTLSLTTPAEGAVVSGATVLSGMAEDNKGLSHVTIYIDGRKWKTVVGVGPAAMVSSERAPEPEAQEPRLLSVSAPWSFVLDTTQLDNSSHVLRVEAHDTSSNSVSSTRTFVTANGATIALFDSTVGAPACGAPGVHCASGGRLEGRGPLAGFPEPNSPNTLSVRPCPDGTSGSYHSDESLDWLRVTSVDGSPLAPGKVARVDARVWAYSLSSNFLDLYYAPAVSSVTWTRLGTLSPSGTKMQVLSTTFTLTGGGAQQVVRGEFRYGGTASPGACASGSYNDHDDLVFAVQQPPLAPSAGFSAAGATSLTLTWAPSLSGSPAAGFRIDVSTSAVFDVFHPGFSDLELGNQQLKVEILSLLPHTTYFARVRAYNAAGISPYSATAVGTTLDLPDLVVSSFGVSPAVMRPGTGFDLPLVIRNAGGGPSSADLNFQAFLDGSSSASWGAFIPALAPGQSFSWKFSGTAGAEGTHTVRLVADALNKQMEWDETNNTATLSFLVDGTPPVVTLTSPLPGSTVTGPTPIAAVATDVLSGIKQVVFSVNGVTLSTVTAAPFQSFWDASTASVGTHVLSARATDVAGNLAVSSITVNVVVPHGAQITSSSLLPASVVQRQRLTVSVTMKNTGTRSWTKAGGYQLGSVDPADNVTWGLARVALGSSDVITQGASKTFLFNLTAPSIPGDYSLAWQMMKAGLPVEYFGEKVFALPLSVLVDTAPPTVPVSATLGAPSTTTLMFSWSPSSDASTVAAYRVDVATDEGFVGFLPGFQNNSLPGNIVSLKITGLAPGTRYWARVRAVDSNGNISANRDAAPQSTLLTADVSAPIVSISSPTANQIITSNITVLAVAADDVGVSQVGFYIDGVLKALDGSAPYSFVWAASAVADGPHVVHVTASDHAGNKSSATVGVLLSYDRTAPSAPAHPILSLPAATQLVLSWDSSSDNVGVTGYRVDVSTLSEFTSTLPVYSNLNVGKVLTRTITGLAMGATYYARVKAFDANSNISAVSLTATGTTLPAVDATAPTVKIVSPLANTVVRGTVTVTVDAADNTAVARVLFYLDGSRVLTDSDAPYLFAWDTGLASTGTHKWTAVAYDTTGNAKTSSNIYVTVSRGAAVAWGAASLSTENIGDEPLAIGNIYSYPHPIVNGGTTLHMEVGSADRVMVRIQRLSGEAVLESEATHTIRTPEGKQAHELHWNTGGLPSGTYVWTTEAEKAGEKVRVTKRQTVIQ
jgi:subtilisin family serine protease